MSVILWLYFIWKASQLRALHIDICDYTNVLNSMLVFQMHPPPMKRSTCSRGCEVWARSWWLCATVFTSKDSRTVSRSTRTPHHRPPSRLSQPTLPRLSPPTTHTTNQRRERRRRSLEISRTHYHRLSATAHLPQEVSTVWKTLLIDCITEHLKVCPLVRSDLLSSQS